MMMSVSRLFLLSVSTVLFVGCALIGVHQMNERYGFPQVIDRSLLEAQASTESSRDAGVDLLAGETHHGPEFYRDIKPIVDTRCVVCHGCYDAPCQLKMTSFESIDRGANKQKVYDGTRLVESTLTHLPVGAKTTEQWRAEDFYPVLNERRQSPEVNAQGSVIHRMLQLKKAHPLPDGELLPESFDLSLDRQQECSKIEEFDSFERQKPLWGMPYGLPAIEAESSQLLQAWIESGAKVQHSRFPVTQDQAAVDRWEAFFNGSSLKQQLMSRYVYEHLFLANLYFSESFSGVGEARQFFKLVRSTTAPGTPIAPISTRRPFDDPGSPFFYRLKRVKSTLLAKQHLPYALNGERLKRWTELFLEADYSVSELPSYDPKTASNPFISFEQIPVNSRYRFMLDEAQFTIMGFIKGPVCRGQVALNVINDHFWVLFVEPDVEQQYATGEFLAREAEDLMLPAEKGSTALLPLSSWLLYSKKETRYLAAREERLGKIFSGDKKLGLSMLWDGEGVNPNAALTVYRHFDSASVIKGLSGNTPKTAWVIDYSLLERIHYLLVAGFDVYGNVGHQLLTRLYMDFLRMEGEYSFLRFFPNDYAAEQLSFWYRGGESQVAHFLDQLHDGESEITAMTYHSDAPKAEFFDQVRRHMGEQVVARDTINSTDGSLSRKPYQQALHQLSQLQGSALQLLPEQSLMRLTLASGERRLISVIVNRAHTNVSHLFGEESRFAPEEYTISVIEGVVGTYPNALWDVEEQQLSQLVSMIASLSSETDYRVFISRYGVRRTDSDFWRFSDSVHNNYLQSNPIESSYLDFNRLENR